MHPDALWNRRCLDPQGGVMIIEEIGPCRVEQDGTVVECVQERGRLFAVRVTMAELR
jgi:hypothetical protein